MYTIAISLLALLLGTIIGSFLSVVIYRIRHKKKGIFLSRSICPHCNTVLQWRYLVPLFSWLFLRGRCAYCQSKISSHYFFLELVTGLLFMVAYLQWPFIEYPLTLNPEMMLTWLFFTVELALLSGIFFYDILYKEIPDVLSIPGIAIAIAGSLVLNGTAIAEPKSMLFGAAVLGVFFAAQYVFSRGKWLGGGDIRLGILMGALLGLPKGVLAALLAYLIGTLITLPLLLTKKLTPKTQIAFGPFLIIGTLISLLYGEYIIEWYLGTMGW